MGTVDLREFVGWKTHANCKGSNGRAPTSIGSGKEKFPRARTQKFTFSSRTHLSYLQKKMSALSVPTAMSASDYVTAPSRIFFRASHTTSAYVINHLP